MKNYWLRMTANKFQKAVCNYLDGKIDKEKLSEAFYWLAELVVDQFKANIPVDRDDAIQEGVMICWEKLPRYDRTKGVAFNFFTTIIISLLRQTYRASKNYQELKRRYQEALSSSRTFIKILPK